MWASKEWPQFGGVLALTPGNPRRTEKLLSLQPVEEIWGWSQDHKKAEYNGDHHGTAAGPG